MCFVFCAQTCEAKDKHPQLWTVRPQLWTAVNIIGKNTLELEFSLARILADITELLYDQYYTAFSGGVEASFTPTLSVSVPRQ